VADALSGDPVARALAAVERADDDPQRARTDALALLDEPDVRRNTEATSRSTMAGAVRSSPANRARVLRP